MSLGLRLQWLCVAVVSGATSTSGLRGKYIYCGLGRDFAFVSWYNPQLDRASRGVQAGHFVPSHSLVGRVIEGNAEMRQALAYVVPQQSVVFAYASGT